MKNLFIVLVLCTLSPFALANDSREVLAAMANKLIDKNKYVGLSIRFDFTSKDMNQEVEFNTVSKSFESFFKSEVMSRCFLQKMSKKVEIVIRPTSKGWPSDTDKKGYIQGSYRENYVSVESDENKVTFIVELDHIRESLVFWQYRYRLSKVTSLNFRKVYAKHFPLCSKMNRQDWFRRIIKRKEKQLNSFKEQLKKIDQEVTTLQNF